MLDVAPNFVIANAPLTFPNIPLSSSESPLIMPKRKADTKASPAPVVSTTDSTSQAGILQVWSRLAMKHPLLQRCTKGT